jgi:hypothetical protein
MLSATYGVMAMMPITFGIASYVLVSRDRAGRPPAIRLGDKPYLKHQSTCEKR